MTKVVVGLGNPGKQYDNTRHNVGFMVIDHLSKALQTPVSMKKFKGLVGEVQIKGEKIVLVKPQTYMNLSGESVRQVIDWYKVSPEDLVVIYDDLDLSPGVIRLRYKGSSGGHNGMKSIISHIGTEDFKRIKIGIGRPPAGWSVPDYVLSSFSATEYPEIQNAIQKSADAIQEWFETPFEKVMSTFN